MTNIDTDTDIVADKKRKRIIQINTKSKSKVKLKPLPPQNPCFSTHFFKHRHLHFPTQTLLLCSHSTQTSYILPMRSFMFKAKTLPLLHKTLLPLTLTSTSASTSLLRMAF